MAVADDIPYISTPPLNRGYDTAGASMNKVIPGGLRAKENNWPALGEIIKFDQSEFNEFSLLPTGIYDEGYFFKPNSCTTDKKCRLYLVLHGCDGSAEELGTNFVAFSGFLPWAASNDVILLFPQSKSTGLGPNCWDFLEYSGWNYYNKRGTQPSAIYKMI